MATLPAVRPRSSVSESGKFSLYSYNLTTYNDYKL
jgi:hypothetical protein